MENPSQQCEICAEAGPNQTIKSLQLLIMFIKSKTVFNSTPNATSE